MIDAGLLDLHLIFTIIPSRLFYDMLFLLFCTIWTLQLILPISNSFLIIKTLYITVYSYFYIWLCIWVSGAWTGARAFIFFLSVKMS